MISAEISLVIIGSCCLVGLIYAIFNAIKIAAIKVENNLLTKDVNN